MLDKRIENVKNMIKRLNVAEQELKNALYLCENERIRLDISKNARKEDQYGDYNKKQDARFLWTGNEGTRQPSGVVSNNELFSGDRKRVDTKGSIGSVQEMPGEEEIQSETEGTEGFETSLTKDLPPLISLKRTKAHLDFIESNVKEALKQIDEDRGIFYRFIREWCFFNGYTIVKNEIKP